ncbi:uncharacterized protein LOC103715216 [Phoenix dactylifera]|uniref:Uncharacterized protein LOC103715216 n=1 Tax=Phoenix dactylifera TaxID=42345 RepID=A0A8B7CKE1_PHODC|nr:uncharacterized protein LOC103715216 [Phoenix dactylifera]
MAPFRGKGGATGGTGDGRSEKALRLSVKNRTKSLCKKASELATLCDVELALVCYPSDAAEPTTWPPERSKVEDVIRHYLDAPANKKLPKNQITLDNPNPGADKKKGAGEAAEAKAAAKKKAEEAAERLRIPFPDDEEKLTALGRILGSRLEVVRKMIAVRRMEAPDQANKLAVVPASAGGGEAATSDPAEDFGSVSRCAHPGFSAPASAPVAGADGMRCSYRNWFA